MKLFIHAFFMCQSMFCAIPCPCKVWDEDARDRLLWCLPLVGLEIGLVWWALGLVCRYFGLTQAATALVLCGAPYFLTGFLHLDGFMDVTDAVKSYRDLERRREILKDSHVGSFAVIGCVLLILAQFAFCVSFNLKTDFRMLMVIPVVSRCCSALAVNCLPKMTTSQYARKKVRPADIWIPLLFLAAALTFGFLLRLRCGLVLVVELAAYALALLRSYRSLKGMNGDISGYCLTIGELAALGALAIL